MRALAVAAALVTLAIPLRAWARDYWLVPQVLLSAEPVEVPIRLYVGDDLVAEDEKGMQPGRTGRFLVVHAGGWQDLMPGAVEGARPIATIGPLQLGGHLVVLDRTPARVELDAREFEAYLREEGLDGIAGERARRGEGDRPGRERHERFLKAIVRIGSTRDSVFRRVMGQTLEILPILDPTMVAAGTLRVSVRFRDAPIGGLRVELLSHMGARVHKSSAETDERGEVSLDVPAEGIHLVRAVHMIRCDGCEDADWHSFWSDYTFANGPVFLRGVVTAPSMLGPVPARARDNPPAGDGETPGVVAGETPEVTAVPPQRVTALQTPPHQEKDAVTPAEAAARSWPALVALGLAMLMVTVWALSGLAGRRR